ncbi:MAG: hypothetical protein ABI301_00390 [Jatrophihabitantaceae bacterium]
MSEPVRMSGAATAEEVIAVLAALSRHDVEAEPTGYELWRRRRLRAIRNTARPV